MGFQTDDLSLLVLGIEGDHPPDAGQPALPNGIHCRWLFAPEQGFPWFGFYLFRRESQPRQPRCLSLDLRSLRPGASQGLSLETPLGRLSSARPLVFTEEFSPTDTVEVDLKSALLRFDLPAGVQAWRVDLRIGLRSAGPATVRTCIDFRTLPVGSAPGPRTEKGAVFATQPPPVSPQVALVTIAQWSASLVGLVTSRRLTIDLPCPATSVDLLITSRMDLTIEILAADGQSLGVKSFVSGALQLGSVTLTGPAIAKVVLTGLSPDSALLHQICWECPTSGGGKGAPIEVAALAGTAAVAQTVVQGDAGQVVATTLEGQGITAVQINLGNAGLVDLCVWPSQQGVTFGWSEVPGFAYPLCLPVAHPDYPCPGKPADLNAAKALALSRVTYPAPVGWDQGFTDLHGELQALVQGGPTAEAMAARKHPALPGHPLSPATQANVPSLPDLHPLELILLASLQPAVAQMLGLYFVDTTAAAGVAYDYLLLADPTGVLGGSAASALAWLAAAPDPTQVDAFLVTGHSVQPRPSIAPPAAGKAYALPGPAVRQMDGTLPEAVGEVGLWWPLPPDSDEENPDQLVFYYPRRASLGADPNPDPPVTPPADSDYQPLADPSPVLVSEPDPPDPPVPPNPRSSDWPPPSIPLYLVDGNLPEGWYSYRFIGQDLFGRHSPLGPPASWFDWIPAEQQHHAFAVALLDKTPPPVPLGVEAWALDPLDRWLLADQPYNDWRAAVSPDLVGLRVGWRWTYLQQLQAPDTREFRIYYQPGRWNALLGRVVSVAVAAADQSDVDLDLTDTRAAGAFAGARLRVGNNDFAILGSQPGPQLRLRVRNVGVYDEIPPTAGKPCTVAIPEGHPLWADTGLAASWARRLAVVPYEPPVDTVFDPSEDPNGQPLTSHNDAFKTVPVAVTGQDALFGTGPDLSGLQPWIDHLWLQTGTASEAHRIVRYDANTRTVTLEAAPALAGPFDAWVLGRPTREYEIFLPAPDVGAGQPFEPSLAEPAVYAQIAVSAADDKKHVADDPKWNDSVRFGNESRLSPAATVFRILQKPPQAPDLPDLGERLYATPADYHDDSYSTFRFIDPGAPLKVHILRAVDDSLFQRDWLIRETRKGLDPVPPPPPDPPDPQAPQPKFEHLAFFPDAWGFSRRKDAADAINALAGAPYSLPDDAWTVLALLPGNERQPDRPALEKRDLYIRRIREKLAAADTDFFPKHWNDATRDDAAKALNGITDPDSYPILPDNALRTLAALPSNEEVFAQVTLSPLDMADPEIQDRLRPDDAETYKPDSALRAYTDTLPGRATNRYFYRALFVDGAQNQSSLSLPGPPVYLRKVEPPRAPVVTKVIGGEREITIQWAWNRERDLAEYRVYRSDDEEKAGDLRLMELVKTLTPAELDPKKSGPEWTDNSDLIGGHRYFYRLTAADTFNNESSPTRVHVGIAMDTRVPAPPIWIEQTWLLRYQADNTFLDWPQDGIVPAGYKPVLRLVWQCDTPVSEFVVRRWNEQEQLWKQPNNIMTQTIFSMALAFILLDYDVNPEMSSMYRLKVRSSSGAWSVEDAVLAVGPRIPGSNSF
ncbi:MAG TPA: hypothetical protein VLB76_20480 [Thermoanaerobaculia bacterium]|jgi:hypothetical protein|nr:hypothetical protein [Thermoanaerobaculia bacterium]